MKDTSTGGRGGGDEAAEADEADESAAGTMAVTMRTQDEADCRREVRDGRAGSMMIERSSDERHTTRTRAETWARRAVDGRQAREEAAGAR